MMLFGTRITRSGGRTVQRRAGTLLALFALFSQMLISLLPMPAMAELSPDGVPICQFDDAGRPTTPHRDQSPGHRAPDCPVCQAAQLLGSLVPPTPVVQLPEPVWIASVDLPAAEPGRLSRIASCPQARAPPPSI
jgi:hypothetical protein